MCNKRTLDKHVQDSQVGGGCAADADAFGIVPALLLPLFAVLLAWEEPGSGPKGDGKAAVVGRRAG